MEAGSNAGERVTLAHDYLLVMRGAERTFAAMAEHWSKSPIVTLLYDEEGTQGRFGSHTITTSSLQRLGARQDDFRRLLPLYPWAVEHLPVPDCRVVLSSSSAFAHGVRKPTGAVHVCYCHAPFRYAWYEQQRALAETPAPLRPAMRVLLAWLRRWDRAAAARVDVYVANSVLTRERIKRFYGRDSEVVHPPVETHRFAVGEPGERLLVVSEIVRHKRVHVALEAARRAHAPISIVGTGPDHDELRAAYPEAEFLGRVDDVGLAALYARARAVVVPSMEEFGITAVEAQAAGRPVIAASAGGALETVLKGETGTFATLDDPDSFAEAIRTIDALSFDPARTREHAESFSVAAFQQKLAAVVQQALQ